MTTTTTIKTTTALEQFYTELLKDSVLQARLQAATDPESLSELAVELGKEKGYCFTQQEVLAAMAIEAAMGGEYMEEGHLLVVSHSWNTCDQCAEQCIGGCLSYG